MWEIRFGMADSSLKPLTTLYLYVNETIQFQMYVLFFFFFLNEKLGFEKISFLKTNTI